MMGNQLRIFARNMFRSITQSNKNKLAFKARKYLDQLYQDQLRLQKFQADQAEALEKDQGE